MAVEKLMWMLQHVKLLKANARVCTICFLEQY